MIHKRLSPSIKSGPVHTDCDGDGSWTAEYILDDPRQPIIERIGLLDAHGVPLVRVLEPVKQRCGFETPGWAKGGGDEFEESIVPIDMITIQDGQKFTPYAKYIAEQNDDDDE